MGVFQCVPLITSLSLMVLVRCVSQIASNAKMHLHALHVNQVLFFWGIQPNVSLVLFAHVVISLINKITALFANLYVILVTLLKYAQAAF